MRPLFNLRRKAFWRLSFRDLSRGIEKVRSTPKVKAASQATVFIHW